MLKLLNVSKRYNKNSVFDALTIDMSNPGLYIFLGINGSGKSTILKIISKVIYKTDGKIESDVSISYLPDKCNLPKLMNVKSYVNTVLDMYGKKDMSLELISKFQIPNRRIGDLSKGNQQKLALLQVLYNDCDCYVLDEPLDGLDDFAKHLFKDIIKELIDNGKIIVMSLHQKQLFNDLNPIIYDIKDGFVNKKIKRNKKEKQDEKQEL